MKVKVYAARITMRCLGPAGVVVMTLLPLNVRAGQGDRGGETAAASPKGAAMKIDAAVESPQVIAVRFRHDSCPYCQKFDPQFPKLVRETKDQPVLFVTFDLTSEATQKQAALLAGALGLGHVWTGDLSQVGTITFVDGKSKQVLSSLRAESLQKVKAAVHKACQTTRD